MNDMNDMNEKARFLFKNKITTHIDTKDGSFYNGLLIELHDVFVVINDRILGEVPVTFSEIKKIGRFRG